MLRQLASMEMSDDEKLDKMIGPEAAPPDFPSGLQFTIDAADLAKVAEGEAAPDATLDFAAMGIVTSIARDRTAGTRIELDLTELAGADGQFAPLDRPPAICLCGGDFERLDLEDECQKGDTLHLIGVARVERTNDPAYGDGSVTLQITHMTVEDESEESRDGG